MAQYTSDVHLASTHAHTSARMQRTLQRTYTYVYTIHTCTRACTHTHTTGQEGRWLENILSAEDTKPQNPKVPQAIHPVQWCEPEQSQLGGDWTDRRAESTCAPATAKASRQLTLLFTKCHWATSTSTLRTRGSDESTERRASLGRLSSRVGLH